MPNQGIKRKFTHHHHEAGFHALGIRQKLTPDPRSGPVGAHHQISFGARPVLEAGNDLAALSFLED